MKLPLFASVTSSILLGFFLGLPANAKIVVNDCVIDGIFPMGTEQPDTTEAAKINVWPETVCYSSYPPDSNSQIAGTILSHDQILQKDLPLSSRVVGQAFKIPETGGDQMLDKIFITVGLRETGGRFTARLVSITENELWGYPERPSLFTSDSSFVTSTQAITGRGAAQIVSFTFTDKDRIRLTAGKWYVFEIIADSLNKPNMAMTWYRSNARNMRLAPLVDAVAMIVPTTKDTTINSAREPLENRQAYIGIKTTRL